MNNFQKQCFLQYVQSPCGCKQFEKLLRHPLVGFPANSILSPVAIGLDYGVVNLGLTYLNHWPGETLSDGFAQLGMGLGDADQYVGIQCIALIDSLGVRDHHFAENGTLDIKLFRWLNANTAIACGAGNGLGWGFFSQCNPSYYGVFTHLFNLNPTHPTYPIPLSASIGMGTGAFVSPYYFQMRPANNRPQLFGNLALRIHPRLSLIGDWASRIATAGVSWMPTYYIPIVVTCFATNLAGKNAQPGPVSLGVMVTTGFKLF